MVKSFKIFSGTSGPISTKYVMKHLGLQLIIVCITDDPWVDLDLFYAKVKFATQFFSIGNSENIGFFRKYRGMCRVESLYTN